MLCIQMLTSLPLDQSLEGIGEGVFSYLGEGCSRDHEEKRGGKKSEEERRWREQGFPLDMMIQDQIPQQNRP